jgi:hypothetical protein
MNYDRVAYQVIEFGILYKNMKSANHRLGSIDSFFYLVLRLKIFK